MSGFDWLLESVLVGLLTLTLLHAIRLERALAGLRRDRTALGEAVVGFDTSTREAEAGMGKLHHLAQGAAEQVTRKIAAAAVLRDDLSYLAERGEHLADRLEALVRSGRSVDPARHPGPDAGRTASSAPADPAARMRSQAERDLMQALRGSR